MISGIPPVETAGAGLAVGGAVCSYVAPKVEAAVKDLTGIATAGKAAGKAGGVLAGVRSGVAPGEGIGVFGWWPLERRGEFEV